MCLSPEGEERDTVQAGHPLCDNEETVTQRHDEIVSKLINIRVAPS